MNKTGIEVQARKKPQWMSIIGLGVALVAVLQTGFLLEKGLSEELVTQSGLIVSLLQMTFLVTALWVFAAGVFAKRQITFNDDGYHYDERFPLWKREARHAFSDIGGLSIHRLPRLPDAHRIVLKLNDGSAVKVPGMWTLADLSLIRQLIEAHRPGSDCPLP